MRLNLSFTGTGLLVAAGLVFGAWYWLAPSSDTQRKDDSRIAATGKPEVIDTNGGQLTVAIVKVTGEQFTKTDPRTILGVPLGTTKSIVQADVTYRYHIEMEKRWPIVINGKTAIVEAPEIKPSLPVAFDSATVKKWTSSGWARFNKEENLAELERSITEEIQRRANSPQYEQIKRDASRESVRRFVTTWLLKRQGWGQPPEYKVVVLFPGETVATATSPIQ